jgi:hypothetical protein
VAGKVLSQGAFTAPLSLWRFPLLGLGIVFTIFFCILAHFSKMSTGFQKKRYGKIRN